MLDIPVNRNDVISFPKMKRGVIMQLQVMTLLAILPLFCDLFH